MNKTKYNSTSEFKLLNTKNLERRVIYDLNQNATEDSKHVNGKSGDKIHISLPLFTLEQSNTLICKDLKDYRFWIQ